MDILIPAALEGQITRERAEKLTCKLVLEGANGPTYPEADDVLAERGVIVVPDVICNAGGVTVSYFEWVQDMASFFWSEEEINAKMDRIMTDAIVHVWDKAAEKECTLRTAAYIVACERILMARKDRGIYPADPHQQPHQGWPCAAPFLCRAVNRRGCALSDEELFGKGDNVTQVITIRCP